MSHENLTTTIELALVGGVLVRGVSELSLVRAELSIEELGDARARAVIEAACEVADRGLEFGPVTIAAALERRDALGLVGGLAGLDRIRDRDRPNERDALIQRVRDHARVRAAQAEVSRLAKAGASPEAIDDPERYLAAVSTLAETSSKTLRRGTMTAGETARVTFEAFTGRGKRSPAIPTPIPALTRYLGGGWWPKRNYIFGARPGVGKTAFAVESMVYGAQRGHPQFMFSREMVAEDLGGRSVVLLADIDAERWEKGPSAFTKDEGRSIVGALERFSALPIEIDYEEGEIGAMLARLRVWLDVVVRPMQEENPELIPMVWVDYLQECHKAGKHQNRDVMLGEVMSGLAGFSRKYGVAMGVVAACNRANKKENRPPRSDDLRECGAAEYHANTVLLFHRDSGATFDEDGNPKPELVEQDGLILVDKNRGGRTGTVKSTWIGKRGKWVERRTEWTTDSGRYAEH